MQLDGYGYRTLRYHLDLLATRLRRPSSWKTLLRLLFLRPPATARREDIFVRDFAPRREVEAEIQALVDSGTELLYVYTSGVAHYYRYRKQFVDMFPNLDSRGRIAVEFFPLADHTYVFPEDRERLFEAVTGWLTSREWSADTGVDRARLP